MMFLFMAFLISGICCMWKLMKIHKICSHFSSPFKISGFTLNFGLYCVMLCFCEMKCENWKCLLNNYIFNFVTVNLYLFLWNYFYCLKCFILFRAFQCPEWNRCWRGESSGQVKTFFFFFLLAKSLYLLQSKNNGWPGNFSF